VDTNELTPLLDRAESLAYDFLILKSHLTTDLSTLLDYQLLDSVHPPLLYAALLLGFWSTAVVTLFGPLSCLSQTFFNLFSS
jgi:hypothetical protein